jgi:hypothetical protein
VFQKLIKNIGSFSVTKRFVNRLKNCIGHIIQVVSQNLKNMGRLLILLCLCFNLTVSGATYYISTSGSDSNNNIYFDINLIHIVCNFSIREKSLVLPDMQGTLFLEKILYCSN